MDRKLMTGALLSACLVSCNPATPPAEPLLPAPSANAAGSAGAGRGRTDSSVPINLQARDLQNAGLSTADLTYHFHYLTVDKSDSLAFPNGAAHLLFAALPTAQQGDLTLEVLQTGVVKLRGVIAGLTLKPGPMTVPLPLTAVTDTGSATATDTATGTDTGSSTDTGTGTGTGTAAAAAPSFLSDVKPIFDRACVQCHRAHPGSPDLGQQPSAALMDSVLRDVSGTTPSMPTSPDAPLGADDIAKLQAWRTGGMNP